MLDRNCGNAPRRHVCNSTNERAPLPRLIPIILTPWTDDPTPEGTALGQQLMCGGVFDCAFVRGSSSVLPARVFHRRLPGQVSMLEAKGRVRFRRAWPWYWSKARRASIPPHPPRGGSDTRNPSLHAISPRGPGRRVLFFPLKDPY